MYGYEQLLSHLCGAPFEGLMLLLCVFAVGVPPPLQRQLSLFSFPLSTCIPI